MVGRTQQLTEWAKAQSVKHVPISLFCEQHDALIASPSGAIRRTFGDARRAKAQMATFRHLVNLAAPRRFT